MQLAWNGSIKLDPDIDLNELPHHLLSSLREVKATSLEIKGRRLFFAGGVFRLVNRGNVLAPFGSGSLIIDERSNQLRYTVGLLQFAMISGIIILFATILLLITQSAQSMWLFVPLLVLTSFGALLIGINRFSAYLLDTLERAPRKAAIPHE